MSFRRGEGLLRLILITSQKFVLESRRVPKKIDYFPNRFRGDKLPLPPGFHECPKYLPRTRVTSNKPAFSSVTYIIFYCVSTITRKEYVWKAIIILERIKHCTGGYSVINRRRRVTVGNNENQ